MQIQRNIAVRETRVLFDEVMSKDSIADRLRVLLFIDESLTSIECVLSVFIGNALEMKML